MLASCIWLAVTQQTEASQNGTVYRKTNRSFEVGTFGRSIDDFHFGKVFMKTIPDAVIQLSKWNEDLQPVDWLEEAWFRIVGIPMKYREKSTPPAKHLRTTAAAKIDENLQVLLCLCVGLGGDAC